MASFEGYRGDSLLQETKLYLKKGSSYEAELMKALKCKTLSMFSHFV